MHRLPAEVLNLARTLKRPPGSLTNKMLNLEGARPNCARVEPEVFLLLGNEPDRFLHLYRRVLLAAREVGLPEEAVPDVLNVLSEGEIALLGQDELGPREVQQGLEERRAEISRIDAAFEFGEEGTTRLVEHRARLGQHRFAHRVLRDYDQRCGFCGFSPRGLPHHGLLVASHIKPWSRSTDRERLDPRNGVAACPTHDRAFDSGLITVNGGMRIHRAQMLEMSLVSDPGVGMYFGEQILQERLVLPGDFSGPGSTYLQYHHDHIFKRQAAAGWEPQ